MPENTNLGPMKITQWGECSSIWDDLMKNAKTVIGGFEFDLLEFRSIVEKHGVPSTDFLDILTSYCYIPAEKNPNGIDIRTAFLTGEPVKAIFDPLASANLNWDLIHAMLKRNELGSSQHTTNTASIQSKLLDQIDIRLNLFANREAQRAVVTRLKEEQRKLLSSEWVLFADRIDIFWETAYKVCLKKTYDSTFQHTTYQAKSDKAIVNLFFMANTDFRWSYLNKIRESIDLQRKVPQNLKILSKMMDTLLTALRKIQNASNWTVYENAILQAINLLQENTHQFTSLLLDCRYMMLDMYVCQDFLDQLDDLPFYIDNLIRQLLSERTIDEKIAAIADTKDEIELTLSAWTRIEAECDTAERLRFKQASISPVGIIAVAPALSDDAFNAALATIPDHPQETPLEEPETAPTKHPRYYVSSDPDAARLLKEKDGIVRFGNAKKRAEKMQMNVYDSSKDYALVYSAGADQHEAETAPFDSILESTVRKPENA